MLTVSVLWDGEALRSKEVEESFNIHFGEFKKQNRDRRLV